MSPIERTTGLPGVCCRDVGSRAVARETALLLLAVPRWERAEETQGELTLCTTYDLLFAEPAREHR